MGNRLCFKKKANDNTEVFYQNDGEIVHTG